MSEEKRKYLINEIEKMLRQMVDDFNGSWDSPATADQGFYDAASDIIDLIEETK